MFLNCKSPNFSKKETENRETGQVSEGGGQGKITSTWSMHSKSNKKSHSVYPEFIEEFAFLLQKISGQSYSSYQEISAISASSAVKKILFILSKNSLSLDYYCVNNYSEFNEDLN